MQSVMVWSFSFPLKYKLILRTVPIAAFDVQLGTIQDDSHPLAKKYKNYLSVSP